MCLSTKLIRNPNGGKVKPNRAEPSVAIQMYVVSLIVIVAARLSQEDSSLSRFLNLYY